MRAISRRTFVAGSVISVVLQVLGQGVSSAAGKVRRHIGGRLQGFADKRTVTVTDSAGTHDIKFIGSATFNRDGVAALEEFRRGDEVVVALSAGGQRGDRMELLYRWYYGHVQSYDDTHLYTDTGRFRLDARTEIHVVDNFYAKVPPRELTQGTEVHVTSRWDPVLDEHIARSIGVESA